MKRWIKTLVVSAVMVSGLTGCPAFIVGGAAVGGLAATDRRSVGAQTDDSVIEAQVAASIANYWQANPVAAGQPQPNVKVISYNRHGLLLGYVASEAEKTMAERALRAQPNVAKVYNYINVAPGDRKFGNVSQDTWITSKIRTNLLNAQGFIPNRVKVITYDGVTYVFGILTPAEQAAATAQISATSGVQRVVTLYETFTETEQPAAAAAPAS
ncbi:MAG: BON domain-containing protein [Neisseriaceae bacterium]|nr:BON domain-containing protein [Neisseriaceae bacterium]MBP6862564.1 BON domain-containing protein [Neisseriaceae bacterium]